MPARLKIAAPRIASREGIEVRIPLPVRNTIQGGAHGVIKAKVGDRIVRYEMSDLDIQERHLIPNTYDMGYNQLITNTIQDVAMNLIFSTDGMKAMGTCNEGGIGALFRNHGEEGAWKILTRAVEMAGYDPGRDVFFGVDGAADRFYKGNGVYSLNDRNYSTEELMDLNSVIWKAKKDKGLSLRSEIAHATIPDKFRCMEKDIKEAHNMKELKYGKDISVSL